MWPMGLLSVDVGIKNVIASILFLFCNIFQCDDNESKFCVLIYYFNFIFRNFPQRKKVIFSPF